MVCSDTEPMVLRRIQAERIRGRAYQPRFEHHVVLLSWAGGLAAIGTLGLISAWSHYLLVVAPFGASTVLLFGYPSSPLRVQWRCWSDP